MAAFTPDPRQIWPHLLNTYPALAKHPAAKTDLKPLIEDYLKKTSLRPKALQPLMTNYQALLSAIAAASAALDDYGGIIRASKNSSMIAEWGKVPKRADVCLHQLHDDQGRPEQDLQSVPAARVEVGRDSTREGRPMA